MKLKCRPEDFEVDELTDVAPAAGPFALYRLTKRSIGTPEVIDAVVRRWEIPRARISFGGLKDRHALTRQFVTIWRGPTRNLEQTGFDLKYLGQAERPFTPKDIRGNRFAVVMRDMSRESLAEAERAIGEVQRDGVPNYFDDQRFGSVGESGEFIGRAWCEERYERALWLALAEPNEHDRPEDRDRKKLLRDKWGNWTELKGAIDRSHARSIVSFLVDRPGDYKGALGRMHKEERSLWLAAFQSDLWNKLLDAYLRETVPADRLLTHRIGVFFKGQAVDAKLPLPSARLKIADERLERVLVQQGLTLKRLRIKHPKDSFFSKGDRAAIVRPAELKHESAADELYEGRRKLTLRFDLARGCYATILVKRLTEL